jgi:hypothetical protein
MSEYKIYPKQFRNKKIPIEKNRCFFIMPFSDKFDIVYGELKNSLSRENYICVRADEISGSTPIITKILTELLKAQFIIVDLTDCNPNVFYELGIAHTFKDAENIFLLKEQNSKVPFDITHLKYMEYDKNNMHYLTSKLKTALAENTYISNFYEALNTHGIINYVQDNHEEFIELLKNMLAEDIALVTEILECSCEIQEKDIELIICKFETKLKHTINTCDSTTLRGIMNFYEELLLSCDKYSFAKDHLQIFISDFFIDTRLATVDKISYETDMVLKFAYSEKQINIVMPWIISYFKKSKSGTIDLNRYKLESFLLVTQSSEVNRLICNAITDSDAHIREHLADIIGEKNLIEAHEILCHQLMCEKNFYTASSIIEALGKLGKRDCFSYIQLWINKNEKEIINTKHWFVFKHARIAIGKLNPEYLKSYDKKYKDYLTDFLF